MAENYLFRGIKGQTLVKRPGDIGGLDFLCEDLHDCTVHLLDTTSQVQIDDCVNCTFVIGPCAGSIFVRDCQSCTLSAASQQLRTRGCTGLDLRLHCASQPSIETSTDVRVAPLDVTYAGLDDQFASAGLDAADNKWDRVYDFSPPDDGSLNYTLVDPASQSVRTIEMSDMGDFAGDAPAGDFAQFEDTGFPADENGGGFADEDMPTKGSALDEDLFGAPTDGPVEYARDPEPAAPVDEEARAAQEAREEKMRQRMMAERQKKEEMAEDEAARRRETRAAAGEWLSNWRKERATQLEAKAKANREAEQVLLEATEKMNRAPFWEQVLSMVDTKKTTSRSGVDLGRFKMALFAGKALGLGGSS
ncbi:unnamed protein product [Pedinophyceae sp. YPF-701]|nr:unnamed protein product [Pedinophyceae sp. YPF-701]